MEIKLNGDHANGRVTIVSEEDYETLSKYKSNRYFTYRSWILSRNFIFIKCNIVHHHFLAVVSSTWRMKCIFHSLME